MSAVQDRTGETIPMPTLTQKTPQQPERTVSRQDRRWWNLAVASPATTFMTRVDRKATRVTWKEPGALAAGNPAALLARWR